MTTVGVNVVTEYAWQGEVIKLNQKDYARLERTFTKLDLGMELLVMDMAFTNERPDNWYMAMLYKLRYQHEKAAKQPDSTRERSLEQDLTDRGWASNVRAIGQSR